MRSATLYLALNITITGERGVLTPTLTGAQPALYTSKLQHPGILFGRGAEDGDVVEILAEHLTATAAAIEWRTITLAALVDFIALHDLLNLLKAAWAERRRHQRHRGGTLSRHHIFQADSGPGNRSCWEIRPAFALLIVVKCEQHLLPLLLIECRNEVLRGAHDAGRGCLRHGGACR